jgi:hypothetical protein
MSIEPYTLTPAERPHINGLLIDTEIALMKARMAHNTNEVEVLTGRAATLRRLLAAFPVNHDVAFRKRALRHDDTGRPGRSQDDP